MIDKHSTVPVYLQLEQYLTGRICAGDLRPGDVIPSENELCQQFSVSRMTARKAVDYLVRQGKVERRRGQGTFVAHPKKSCAFRYLSIAISPPAKPRWALTSR